MNLLPANPARLAGLLLGLGAVNVSAALAAPLGQNVLTAPGGYTSYIRIAIILVAILPWLSFCQWVDKDTVFVKRMNREAWNGIILSGGVVGLAVWLLLPWNTP